VKKIDHKYEKFIKSLAALARSIKLFSSPTAPEKFRTVLVTSLIKHYELCFATSRQFLQIYLKQNYAMDVSTNRSKTIFKICYDNNIIDKNTAQELLAIFKARKATIYDYDEEKAYETCKRVSEYCETFKKLKNFIEKSGYSLPISIQENML